MTHIENSLADPMQRYHRRMVELAETDPLIKALIPKTDIARARIKPDMSVADIMAISFDLYADRPALGERSYKVGSDAGSGRQLRHYLPDYTTITYRELRERVEALASAWTHHESCRVAVDDFICILGSTGTDFTTVELAASYAQAVTVPLQSTLAGTEIDRILDDTAPAILVATLSDLALAVRLAIANGKIHQLIVIDYDPRDDDERVIYAAAQAEIAQTKNQLRLDTIADLVAFGRGHLWQPRSPHSKGPARLASIIHSSGSTGTPKGAMMPENSAAHNLVRSMAQDTLPVVGFAYAPMNHLMGRGDAFGPLVLGGTAYFTMKPDLSTLFEDIRLARPTSLKFIPRIFDLIYQHYQSEVVRRIAKGQHAADADAQVRAEMGSSFLGDRLRGGSFGSAPTARHVMEFVRDCFDIMLCEGYGTTECGSVITVDGLIQRPPVIDYKLVDVPELGYHNIDKPYPRGELYVKTTLQSPGYFKRPDATALLFDKDGYLRTGDIIEQRAPDHLVCIDRRNDVLKLSQAEFVALGPLGTVFEGGSAVIKQIYIYGNSARAYLLAVVVPDLEVATTIIGHAPSASALKTLIREQMQMAARNAKLRTFELPRDFIIEMEPFSHENGLLSSLRKRMRPNFQRKYGERLEQLYTQIEGRRQEELTALRRPGSTLTTLEKVVKALEASFGIDGIDPQTTLTFAELGGDSLGSVSFSMFLEDIFGVEIPVNAIISPAGNPRRWARMIETSRGAGQPTAPAFATIHGKGARILQARDLDIERFLDRPTREKIPTAAPPAVSRTVLLTGAAGFLGRFLCLEWLERMASRGGKVICLIRASNDAEARQRLDKVFSGLDAELEEKYRSLAAQHLEVFAGDIAEPGLGLAMEIWDSLADQVDHIVHPAALVNHVLSYDHLFGPNVFGTAELIRLALTRRIKRFDFISSLAVVKHVDSSSGNNEESPLLESLTLGSGYAGGYGATKWANEVQLHSAHQKFGLPVNIFRGDMMLPHTRFKGQINVPDMITRLLYSVIKTGSAPASFYKAGPDGRRPMAHYDGLPVDFIAGAMAGIGNHQSDGIRTYNVINHHAGDGISLDSFVDWIISAGYPVQRTPDYAEWIADFESKLGALPESQRQHSSLAILAEFRHPHPPHEPAIGSGHFSAAVQALAVGPDVPHLSERFIHKYLDDMRRLNLIN